jgi:hypothetical protein
MKGGVLKLCNSWKIWNDMQGHYHLRVYCTCDSLEAFMSNVQSCCSTAWKFGIFVDQLSQIVLSQSMLQFMSLEFWEVPLGCDLDLLLQTCPTLLLWGPLWSLIHCCGDWMLVILLELRLEGSISTSGRCRLKEFWDWLDLTMSLGVENQLISLLLPTHDCHLLYLLFVSAIGGCWIYEKFSGLVSL